MKNLVNSILHFLKSKHISTNFIKYTLDTLSVVLCWFVSKCIILSYIKVDCSPDIYFLLIISTAINYILGFYRHLWRFTSLYNTFFVIQFSLLTSITMGIYSYIKGEEKTVELYFLFFTFLFLTLIFLRILVRKIFEQKKYNKTSSTKIVVIGAGKGSELFVRESKRQVNHNYEIVKLIDDDPTLWGKKLLGIEIYGPIKNINNLLKNNNIEMVVIAIPSLEKNRLDEISQIVQPLGVSVKILPSFEDLLLNNYISSEDVSLNNLLGREKINLNIKEVSTFIKGKIILVSGAGGSIGSEICRQLVSFNPKLIILVDHSEYNLYSVGWELENTHKYTKFIPILADVGNLESIEKLFIEHSPHIIFHAAAYKHVPLLERQIKKAVINNFLGTKNIVELASKHKSEKFILISTDKAVNPTNIMGTTKRMAEIFCQNFNTSSQTDYIIVRFGNVLGSAGSVIPLFQKQLMQGGPITVTHPEITRFFMSIPEAAQLVLQAGELGKGGEIFVLDMGKPIKISDLAERLIILMGKKPYKDIDIIFTGLRPGEKLYEELFYNNEEHIATENKKIFLANQNYKNFEKFLEQAYFLEKSINSLTEKQTFQIISKMVPEANLKFY